MSTEPNNSNKSNPTDRKTRSQTRSKKEEKSNENSEPTPTEDKGTDNLAYRKRKRNLNPQQQQQNATSTTTTETSVAAPDQKENASNATTHKKQYTKRSKTKGEPEKKDSQTEEEDEEASLDAPINEDVMVDDSAGFDLVRAIPAATTPNKEEKLDHVVDQPRNTDPSDFMEDLYILRNTLAGLVTKLPKNPSLPAPSDRQVWGNLVPQNGKHPLAPLFGTLYTIGSNTKSNLYFRDLSVPNFALKIHHMHGVVLAEGMSNTGSVFVNGKPFKKGSKSILKNGDEITVTGTKSYTYVFHSTRSEATSLSSSTGSYSSSKSNADSSPSLPAFLSRNRRKKSPPLADSMESETANADSTDAENNNSSAATKDKDSLDSLKKQLKQEFANQIINFKDIDVTFDTFPYHLNATTKQQILSSAFVYLVKPEYTKFLADLPISRRILLSGPTGTDIYQEKLAKALAHHFKANLLILDPSSFEADKPSPSDDDFPDDMDFEISDYSRTSHTSKHKGRGNCHGPICRILRTPGGSSSSSKPAKVLVALDDNPSRKAFTQSLEDSFLDDLRESEEKNEAAIYWESLFEVLGEDSQPTILFIKDVENLILINSERYAQFQKLAPKITSPTLILGSSASGDRRDKANPGSFLLKSGNSHHTALLDLAFLDHITRYEDRAKDSPKTSKVISKLFPNRINIHPPVDPNELSEWTKKLTADMELLKKEKNIRNIKKLLEKNNLDCSNFDSPLLTKVVYTPENIERIVGWAVSSHLMNNSDIELKNGNLEFSVKDLDHGLTMLKSSEPESKGKTLKDIEPENEFERKLLAEVIPPNEIDIKFEDIGALEEVKQTLKELVMLPLQRPELFSKGNLTKPTKGILLFGPPGTGKTMLAKAVATQCGANFINVSMSTIASKWFGEGEKYVKAIFTLASKISPTVIFVDEVDSILSKRERAGEHEAMRKIKNEFMTNWDGLKSKDNERIIVLAATNRPFDLDDAVLRRLSRRLLIDLPAEDQRVKILKVILSKEDLAADFSYEALAKMTDGFSGSDMKNLCIAAAYQPIRDFLQEEKAWEAKHQSKEGKKDETDMTADTPKPVLRSIGMQDFEKAIKEISASVSEDAFSIAELRRWNEMYGEGGNRRKSTLPYFL